MQTLFSVLSSVFWGLVTLSVLVFVHEGGHFLAARACGVRVTEFFLGLPCRVNLHCTSKKIGTKFGVTPLLLGGYAAICGMDPTDAPAMPTVLTAIHRHGRVSVNELARELDMTEEDVLAACIVLQGWASIVPVYENEDGSEADSRYYAPAYAAPSRDKAGNTVFDGKLFDRASASKEGEPWSSNLDENTFLAQERSKTYIGQGFLKRAAMLLAGIFVNIVCGILLLMSVYSLIGIDTIVNTSVVGEVQAKSIAAKAGLQAGDRILSLGGDTCSTWKDVVEAVNTHADGKTYELVFKRKGAKHTASISIGENEYLGIIAQQTKVHLDPVRSFSYSMTYVKTTAESVVRLLMPQHTKEILDNSTSVVGISIMSSRAAAAGLSTYLCFAGLISLSLGFMNLLPIPPLDGGKLFIEIIQAILGHEIPNKAQNIISYVGVGLFLLLFVYMLRSDILRYIL